MPLNCGTCNDIRERGINAFTTFTGDPIIRKEIISVGIADEPGYSNAAKGLSPSSTRSQVEKAIQEIQTQFDIASEEIALDNGIVLDNYRTITWRYVSENADVPIWFSTNETLPPNWPKYSRNTLGQAAAPYNNKSDVHINNSLSWSRNWFNANRFPLWEVTSHEIGHTAGFGHSEDEDERMFWAIIRGQRPGPDFIAGIKHSYGKFILELLRKKEAKVIREIPMSPTEPTKCGSIFDLSKTFQKGAPSGTPQEYPAREAEKRASKLVSPVAANAHDVPPPLKPGDDGFKEQLVDVLRCRFEVLNGIWPSWYFQKQGITPEPNEILTAVGFDISNPDGAAQFVGKDRPLDVLRAVLNYIEAQEIPLKKPAEHGGIDFLGRIPNAEDLGTKCQNEALKTAFEVKREYGLARPEEILELGPIMTAYIERGCPGHGSYIAGHASKDGAIIGFTDRYYKLSPIQKRKIKDACSMAAHSRTLAGVHYAQDNVEGLKHGERIANKIMDDLGY